MLFARISTLPLLLAETGFEPASLCLLTDYTSCFISAIKARRHRSYLTVLPTKRVCHQHYTASVNSDTNKALLKENGASTRDRQSIKMFWFSLCLAPRNLVSQSSKNLSTLFLKFFSMVTKRTHASTNADNSLIVGGQCQPPFFEISYQS